MNTYYIYISTDANRQFLQAGMTTDIQQIALLNRVVYLEMYSNQADAEKKLNELSFGRIVRERLVRKQNPNWLNLHLPIPNNKKAAVYA